MGWDGESNQRRDQRLHRSGNLTWRFCVSCTYGVDFGQQSLRCWADTAWGCAECVFECRVSQRLFLPGGCNPAGVCAQPSPGVGDHTGAHAAKIHFVVNNCDGSCNVER